MPAEIINLHYKTPEVNKVEKVVESLKSGSVILYPTDSGFSLGCDLSKKNAIEKIRQIRNLAQSKSMTFLCDSLSNISEFAKVENESYRTIKRLIPGSYTFILPASKNVPKYAQDPKRATAGIRVPDHAIAQALLKELGHPIISISAKGDDDSLATPEDIIAKYEKLVDIVVTCDEYHFQGESTIIDMTDDLPKIIREGAGIEKAKEYID